MTTKTFDDLQLEAKTIGVEVRKAYDMDTVLDILRRFGVKKITALDMNQLPEFIAACEEHLRDTADDVDPEAPITVHGAGIKHYMPGDEIKVLHPEVDTANQQHESLANAKPVQRKADHRADHMSPYTIGLPGDLHPSTTVLVLDTANLMGQKLFNAQQKYGLTNGWQDTDWSNPKDGATFTGDHTCRQHAFGHMLKGDPVDVANYMAFMMFHGWSCAPQSREEAQAWVELLQQKFDLVDDNTVLRDLMNKMEERHGNEFNAFFETTIKQIMRSNNLTEVKIDTGKVLLSLAMDPAPLVVSEIPGYLVYRIAEDGEALPPSQEHPDD